MKVTVLNRTMYLDTTPAGDWVVQDFYGLEHTFRTEFEAHAFFNRELHKVIVQVGQVEYEA